MRTSILLLSVLSMFCVRAQESELEEGNIAFNAGRFTQAYDLYKAAGEQYYTQNAFENYAGTHLKMTECLLQAGKPFEAKTLAENTLTFIRKEIPTITRLQARCLTLLGLCQLNLGRNDEAQEALRLAETLFADAESTEAADCLDALGLVYTNNENHQLASQYHEQALTLRRKLFGSQSVEVANSFNNLGRVFLKEDPLQALIYFNRAKGIYEKTLGTDDRRTLRATLNIAFAHMEQKNYPEALKILQDVQAIYDATYTELHPNKPYIRSIIGRVFLLQKEYERALINQKEALKMYISLFGEKHPDVANTYYLIGEVYKAKSEFKIAVELYQQAIYANLPDQHYSTVYDLPQLTHYFNGDILLRTLQAKAIGLEALHFEKSLNVKDIVGAIETYRLCDDLITIIRRKRLSEQDKLRLGQIAKEVYESGIQLSLIQSEQSFNRKKYLEIAFDFCERSKSAVLLEAITESKAKRYAGIPDEQILLEDSLKDEISYLELQLSQPENTDNQEMKDLLFTYQNAYRSFISSLEKNYPEYYALKYNPTIATAAAVQQSLDESTALLSYFLGEQNVYTFIITKKDIKAIGAPKDPEFEKSVTALRNAIKYKSSSAYFRIARSLHQQLIPKLPANLTTLIVLPDGVLGTIPFEALIAMDDGPEDFKTAHYLIKDYSISYDYSASLFINRAATSEQMKPEILLMAPVRFDQNEVRMAALPGTEEEINEIRYLFMGNNCQARVCTGPDASEATLKKEDLDKYKYLHFATHGLVNESEPGLSRIFLKPDDVEDGSLYTGEIYNLRINADLVTLSACETGLGKVAKGEGIVGLSRALQYAGARNIIVSLWKVADASTAQLMIEFYTYNIHNPRHGYNTALQQAKQSLLNSEDYYHPYFWAPFILVGK